MRTQGRTVEVGQIQYEERVLDLGQARIELLDYVSGGYRRLRRKEKQQAAENVSDNAVEIDVHDPPRALGHRFRVSPMDEFAHIGKELRAVLAYWLASRPTILTRRAELRVKHNWLHASVPLRMEDRIVHVQCQVCVGAAAAPLTQVEVDEDDEDDDELDPSLDETDEWSQIRTSKTTRRRKKTVSLQLKHS